MGRAKGIPIIIGPWGRRLPHSSGRSPAAAGSGALGGPFVLFAGRTVVGVERTTPLCFREDGPVAEQVCPDGGN